jgi:hypothetical protein
VAWAIKSACNQCVKVDPRERNTTTFITDGGAFVTQQTNVSHVLVIVRQSSVPTGMADHEVAHHLLMSRHGELDRDPTLVPPHARWSTVTESCLEGGGEEAIKPETHLI